MAELLQNLANTKQIETALDIGDKYRGKMKKCLIQAILLAKVTLMIIDLKIIDYFNQFLFLFFFSGTNYKTLDGNLNSWQKKVSQLLLHQTIVLLHNLLIFIILK